VPVISKKSYTIPMPEYDQGLVDNLKKKLYRKGIFQSDIKRFGFSLPKDEVPTSWDKEENNMNQGPLQSKFLKKFFFFALAFFVLAVVSALYIFTSGGNVISPDELELSLKGPAAIRGGEDFSLNIIVANHNSIPLESVDLIVAFPDGTREIGALEKELSRYKKNIGTVKSGGVFNESVKAALFGESGDEKEITVFLEYRTLGSNAIFEKKKTLKVLISASPLNLSMRLPNEVNVGSEVEIILDISNETDSLKSFSNVLLTTDYPSGFKFLGASPKPLFGNNTWDLGNFNNNTSRSIKITGVLLGQDEEKKLFRATVGVAATGKEGVVGVPYASSLATVSLRRSFVDLNTTLNGQSEESVAVSAGGVIRGDINWTNNLEDKILNAKITVHFTGNALDQSSVLLPKGFYRSTDDTITWTQQHEAALAVIEPGTSSHVSFDFAPLLTSVLNHKGTLNPMIGVEVSFEGARVVSGQDGVLVTTKLNKVIRINTRLDLGVRAIYNGGPFANSGPLPPRANQETTYTVYWSLVNTSNNLENAKVRAIVPSNVRFVGSVSPAGTELRYDPARGELIWNAGTLEARAGDAPIKEVAFQLAVIPSVPQIGQALQLLSGIVLTGRDSFTGVDLTDTVNFIDTRITTDPSYSETISKVAP